MHWHIPRSHPRYESLMLRERLVEAFENGIVVPQGLIAHGRGEAFDYILGEKSHDFALEAEKVTVAYLLLSGKPIISVNGNYAALAAEEIARLSIETGAPIEVNLFYRSEERVAKIEKLLLDHGAPIVLGVECEKTLIPGLESPRGIVCKEGIYTADFVLVAIEDGDRTQALKKAGKKVAAIDLNPFSRTAQSADITIVDEALRATRNMVNTAKELKGNNETLKQLILKYDNKAILSKAFKTIMERLGEAAAKGVIIEI
ncbi:MAG: phosphopantothenate/pantothenate synthetase [Acidilobaceae archaeon]